MFLESVEIFHNKKSRHNRKWIRFDIYDTVKETRIMNGMGQQSVEKHLAFHGYESLWVDCKQKLVKVRS
jgi:hypothetical protein